MLKGLSRLSDVNNYLSVDLSVSVAEDFLILYRLYESESILHHIYTLLTHLESYIHRMELINSNEIVSRPSQDIYLALYIQLCKLPFIHESGFLYFLRRSFHNSNKLLKNFFLDTTYIIMFVAGSNL